MEVDEDVAEVLVPIVFPMHEAIALTVLWEQADENMELVRDGLDFGESCDLAILRIGEALARAVGDKESLLVAGALRARLAQG